MLLRVSCGKHWALEDLTRKLTDSAIVAGVWNTSLAFSLGKKFEMLIRKSSLLVVGLDHVVGHERSLTSIARVNRPVKGQRLSHDAAQLVELKLQVQWNLVIAILSLVSELNHALGTARSRTVSS